jgi:hypothetical protein
MARIHGKKGEIKMDPTGGATAVTVADMNAWTLDMAKDRVEVTAFQDVNKQRVAGLPDYSGTVSGWWSSASAGVFFDAVLGDTAVMLHLVPNTLEPTFFFEGLANLDGSVNVSATGAVAIAGKWDAAGNWTFNKI